MFVSFLAPSSGQYWWWYTNINTSNTKCCDSTGRSEDVWTPRKTGWGLTALPTGAKRTAVENSIWTGWTCLSIRRNRINRIKQIGFKRLWHLVSNPFTEANPQMQHKQLYMVADIVFEGLPSNWTISFGYKSQYVGEWPGCLVCYPIWFDVMI